MRFSTTMNVKETCSKYAVIRLKNSDNLLGLFQLLLHNGYSQVSFVNSLNDTIFPNAERLERSTQTTPDQFSNGIGSQRQSSVSPTSNERKLSSLNLDPILQHNLSQHFGSLSGLPTIPSGFLGLPTLPSLLQHSSNGHTMFTANMLAAEATTPPYSLNTFNAAARSLQQQCPTSKPPLVKPPSMDQEKVSRHHWSSSDVVTTTSTTTCTLTGVTATNTQLRQRGQRSFTDDPSLYVVCRLCKNRIMGSRISNLTNHVRRHSTLKQFQCCYCDYTHNEMAKVRLHMLHNHKDKDSQPIDNLSPEMQTAWEQLMKECFPDHCQPGSGNGASRTASNGKAWKSTDNGEFPLMMGEHSGDESPSGSSTDLKDESPPAPTTSGSSPECIPPTVDSFDSVKTSQCVECSQAVNVKNRARHIRSCHLQCLPFVCSMCGYDHAEHCKVKLHIVLKHDDDPDAHVLTRDVGQMMEQLVPRFFPQSPSVEMSPPDVSDAVVSPVSASADEELKGDEEDVDVDDTLRRLLEARGLQVKEEEQEMGDEEMTGDEAPSWPADLVEATTNLLSHGIKRRYSKRHLLTPYHCPKCTYSSSSYRRITNHITLRHSNELLSSAVVR